MELRTHRWTEPMARLVMLLAGAAALVWPALWGGSPIWDPDGIGYLGAGHSLWRRLVNPIPLITDHNLGSWTSPPWRSEFYSLLIFPLHQNRSEWPVIAMNALLVSWVTWLVVRTLCRLAPARIFCGLIAVLSLVTTAPWSVAFLSPDILGSVLYLGIFLLVFMREKLHPAEAFGLLCFTCWAITCHPTHLLVSGLLCGSLGLLWLVRWPALSGRGRFLLQAGALVIIAALAQLGLHARLFGKPSLLGPQPPFLLARFQGDGPGTEYLRQNCPRLKWVICRSIDRLPMDQNLFLWSADGPYLSASPDDREALSSEGVPLLVGTLRTYPRRQFKQSAGNSWTELTQFALEPKTYSNLWMMHWMDTVVPGAEPRFAAAMPRLDRLNRGLIGRLQKLSAALSAFFLAPLIALAIYRRDEASLGLAVVTVVVVLANAAVTGTLSGYAPRYEARVIWLVPMLFVVMLSRAVIERDGLSAGSAGK